jgi:dTDP-4-amino-4,6-dideoxygalactose transaminase
MSNISAGVGRGQLKVLDKRVEKKREIFNYYKEQFKSIKEITFMPMNDWNFSNCWLTSILVKGDISPLDIILELEKNSIESRPLWKPMHLQPFFIKYDYVGSNVSETLFNAGLCLPSDTKMDKNELDKVISIIRDLFK